MHGVIPSTDDWAESACKSKVDGAYSGKNDTLTVEVWKTSGKDPSTGGMVNMPDDAWVYHEVGVDHTGRGLPCPIIIKEKSSFTSGSEGHCLTA